MSQLKNKKKVNSTRLFFAAAATCTALVMSCSPKTTASQQKTLSAEYLSQGKTVFENSCGKCHDLPSPTAHNAQEWVGIMNWMAPKARLNEEQQKMVYDYVVSVKP